MVQLLIIAMFVAVQLRDREGAPATPESAARIAAVFCGIFAAWVLVQAAALVAGRRLDRTGNLDILPVLDRLVAALRASAGLAMGYVLVKGGWLDAVRAIVGDVVLLDEWLAISPMIVFLVATWWSMYPVERRLKEAVLLRHLQDGLPVHAPLTRVQFIWSALRHQVLLVFVPLSLVSGWGELVPLLAARLGLSGGPESPSWWGVGEPLVTWGGILVIFILAPAILRHVWDTVRIGPGEVRDQVRRVCDAHGVRISGPFLWRTHGSILNGAVVGIFWPLRYLLFTDALVERLDRLQFEGVIAHEIGHVRYRHVLWMGVTVVAAALAIGWAMAGVQLATGLRLEGADVQTPVLTLAILAVVIVLFGAVSRRFEWQADAFAVRHLSEVLPDETVEAGVVTPRAVRTMQDALGSVADLNGVSPRRFDFRHGSIAQRQARLARLVGLRHRSLPIDRVVWCIKIAAGTIVLTTLAMMGIALAAKATGIVP